MKLNSPDLRKIFLNIPFFACLSEKELSAIESALIIKIFAKNQVILAEEEESEYFYFIYSGKVKVLQNSNDKELLLAIHKKGDYFGEMSLLDGKTAPATIAAIDDCIVCFLTKDNFIKYVFNNEKSIQQILTLLCSRLRDSWRLLKIFSFSDADDRIRVALNSFCHKFGTNDKRGTIIDIKLTHQSIANFTAVSRETVSRRIKKMITAGEIELLDKKYFLLTSSFFKRLPFM